MAEWSPAFVAPDDGGEASRVVRLRTAFDLSPAHGALVSARLRATALGVIEVDLNGAPVSDDVLTPGWSSYEWRLRYAEYDVTAAVRDHNALEVRLGPGWYAGRLAWEGQRHLYGDTPAAALELELAYADGSVASVATDASWTWAPSSTTSADLYDGQSIDARIGEPAQWAPVRVVASPSATLEPYVGPPTVRHERIPARRVWRSPSGRLLVDFGENLVGWTTLRVRGEAGATVVLRHAEVLEDDELGTRPLRSAEATDRYTLSGGDDLFEPTFTFHGFRYVEVEGWPESDERLADALEAVFVSSQLTRTGWFESSHELLTTFHENVVRGMRGNFLDLPTDCPQRDERLGWTGDIAAFAPTATFLFDVQDFLTDWMLDLRAETEAAGGVVPYVVPNVLKLLPGAEDSVVLHSPTPTAVWGDAAVWVPWALFEHDGDLERLRLIFPAMRLHGEAVADALSDSGLWDTGFQFGDWLDPAAPPDDPAAALTPTALVATASGHRTFRLLARAAGLLGETEAAARYAELAERMRAAFGRAYVDGGRVTPETVTGYTLAIAFELLGDDDRVVAGERLAALVRENGHRIATGFAGTPFVTDALTLTGHVTDAARLLLQTACPSWLYPVTMGATTVWERWDSMLPDGTINPGEMTSFNHYALGSVADWLHRSVGGIAPAEPGYRTALIAPTPLEGLEWCRTGLRIADGDIRVHWRVQGDEFEVDVQTPVEAILRLPGRADERVAAGAHRRTVALGV